MIAFQVYVNKVKVCTAGIGELDAIISGLMCRIDQDGPPAAPKTNFHVSGVSGKKPFQWVYYDLQVGDRVEICVVDTEKTDTPKEVTCPGGGSCAA
jgi:hypothetical protein